MIESIVPQESAEDYPTAALPQLNERLMRAAEALIQHGEMVPVTYAGREVERECRLLGRGVGSGTVQLAVWTQFGRRVGGRDVRFDEVRLPVATANRLCQVAFEQERVCADEVPSAFVDAIPDVCDEDWIIRRAVVCRSCGLVLTMFAVSPLAAAVGPLAPVRVRPIGCLCSLPPKWLRSMVQDAQAGLVREYAWQGRLMAALAVAGMDHDMAASIARESLPLRPDLVSYAKSKIGRR